MYGFTNPLLFYSICEPSHTKNPSISVQFTALTHANRNSFRRKCIKKKITYTVRFCSANFLTEFDFLALRKPTVNISLRGDV